MYARCPSTRRNHDLTNIKSSSSSSTISNLLIFSLPIGPGAFLVNYALGVGMLGTPYAFAQSGLVLGVAFMVGITFIGVITAMWIIDVRRPQTACTAPSFAHGYLLCWFVSRRLREQTRSWRPLRKRRARSWPIPWALPRPSTPPSSGSLPHRTYTGALPHVFDHPNHLERSTSSCVELTALFYTW
jgi:hypothetical protein